MLIHYVIELLHYFMFRVSELRSVMDIVNYWSCVVL